MMEERYDGYQLHITTWENDADAYATKIISGLTKWDVKFYIDLAKQFYSRFSGRDKSKGLGNGSNTIEELTNVVNAIMEKHTCISTKVRDIWSQFNEECKRNDLECVSTCKKCYDLMDKGVYVYEDIHDALCEIMLYYPFEEIYRYDFSHFTRVFESFKVYYVPQEIVEVTDEFYNV